MRTFCCMLALTIVALPLIAAEPAGNAAVEAGTDCGSQVAMSLAHQEVAEPALDGAIEPVSLGVDDGVQQSGQCSASIPCFYYGQWITITCTGNNFCFQTVCGVWCDGQGTQCPGCIEP